MLFEIGALSKAACRARRRTVAAGIRVGAGVRSWTKAGHPPMVRRQGRHARGAGSGDGRADDRAGQSGRAGLVSPRPLGTLALGPKLLGWFGELHPELLAAFDLKVPVAAFEIFLDAIPEPKPKGKATRRSRPRPIRPIERDFAFVVDAR